MFFPVNLSDPQSRRFENHELGARANRRNTLASVQKTSDAYAVRLTSLNNDSGLDLQPRCGWGLKQFL